MSSHNYKRFFSLWFRFCGGSKCKIHLLNTLFQNINARTIALLPGTRREWSLVEMAQIQIRLKQSLPLQVRTFVYFVASLQV